MCAEFRHHNTYRDISQVVCNMYMWQCVLMMCKSFLALSSLSEDLQASCVIDGTYYLVHTTHTMYICTYT